MKLSSFLDKRLIFRNLKSETKDDAIKEMVGKIAKIDSTVSKRREIIERTILEREHEVSTAMGNSIAIPHGRIGAYDDVIISIGIFETPIECETPMRTQDKVKIIFMIIAGQIKNKLMLKTMSGISKIISKKGVLDDIVKAKDPQQIFEIIKKEEIDISERITAEDVMNPDIEPVKESSTLEEVASRLVTEGMPGLPVVDDFGFFVGEITERELIEFGMPKYTSLMGDLSFMTIGEPFEEYFKNEQNVTVKELFRKNPTIIDKKASIMEIAFLMVTKGKTRVFVVEDKKYYGMIIRSYLIRKVLHT